MDLKRKASGGALVPSKKAKKELMPYGKDRSSLAKGVSYQRVSDNIGHWQFRTQVVTNPVK